ncbi:splicing factor 45 isoform 1 [Camelus ferus]|nr:splicing factor 45 isoform 1 [Camelus ferus]
MSLYDDLGVETSDSKTEGWSKNFKLLQSQLQVKKAALTQAKSQRTKQSTVLAPVIDLKRGGSSDERQIVDTPPHVAAGLKDPVPSGFSAGEVLIPLADEYDPMFPNDYEKVVKRQREERQRQRELERQKEIEERENEGYRSLRWRLAPPLRGLYGLLGKRGHEISILRQTHRLLWESEGVDGICRVPRDFPYEEDSRPRSQSSKAAIPPPVYEEQDRPRSPTGPGNSFLANMGGTVAHKIMQKYGFREGQGLGKHEQGLSTALSVEKTSKRGGKIIVGDATEKDAAKKSDSNPLTEILKCPTKVVLLRNMVGAGEVDEDLEVETKEECEKYGKVGKCVIFEIPGAPDDEAVRIFLEFERVESAIKGLNAVDPGLEMRRWPDWTVSSKPTHYGRLSRTLEVLETGVLSSRGPFRVEELIKMSQTVDSAQLSCAGLLTPLRCLEMIDQLDIGPLLSREPARPLLGTEAKTSYTIAGDAAP